MIGYLDIETSFASDVTVVGILRADEVIQLVGEMITRDHLVDALDGVDELCTFNGEYFDLPVLRRAFGLELLERYRSLDLAPVCKRAGLRGGLKRVEAHLGIRRGLQGVGGYDAMVLWSRWQEGDDTALRRLLEYNREDVVNLATLEARLRGDLATMPAPATRVLGPAATPRVRPTTSSSGTGRIVAASPSLGRAIR